MRPSILSFLVVAALCVHAAPSTVAAGGLDKRECDTGGQGRCGDSGLPVCAAKSDLDKAGCRMIKDPKDVGPWCGCLECKDPSATSKFPSLDVCPTCPAPEQLKEKKCTLEHDTAQPKCGCLQCAANANGQPTFPGINPCKSNSKRDGQDLGGTGRGNGSGLPTCPEKSDLDSAKCKLIKDPKDVSEFCGCLECDDPSSASKFSDVQVCPKCPSKAELSAKKCHLEKDLGQPKCGCLQCTANANGQPTFPGIDPCKSNEKRDRMQPKRKGDKHHHKGKHHRKGKHHKGKKHHKQADDTPVDKTMGRGNGSGLDDPSGATDKKMPPPTKRGELCECKLQCPSEAQVNAAGCQLLSSHTGDECDCNCGCMDCSDGYYYRVPFGSLSDFIMTDEKPAKECYSFDDQMITIDDAPFV